MFCRLALVAFCLLLSACQDATIAHDLSQKQANEIVAVLTQQGIAAHAMRGNGARAQFQVEVPYGRYSESVSILHYEGLPKTEEPSVNELLSPKGFLPNSRELERMRIDRAVAAELENLLKANPSVVEVRAIVRRPMFEGVGPEPPSHVSLIVRKSPGSELNRETVVNLVSNLIPGISPESVVLDIQDELPVVGSDRMGVLRAGPNAKVVHVPMREFLGWFRIAEDDYQRMIWALLLALLGFLLVGLFAGFSAGFLGKKVVSTKPLEPLPTLKSERQTLSLNSPDV